jgi:hypothetical protein
VHITRDQLEDITAFSTDHGRAAELLLQWAAEVSADSEVNRAELLVAASEQYGFAGDQDRRVELCRAAAADGGVVHPDVRCYLISALLDADLDDEAQPLIEQLRHEPGRHVHVDEFLGETLEAAGRHLEAVEVFSAGYARAQGSSAAEILILLNGRRRCREALGQPTDALDRQSLAGLALLRGGGPPLPQGEVAALPGEPEREILVFVPESAWDTYVERFDPGFDSVEAQCAFIENGLRTGGEGLPRVCVPIDAAGLEAHAANIGAQAAHPDTRLSYALTLVRAGEGRPWPPGRNDTCWCGRDRKYKRCCGRPGA